MSIKKGKTLDSDCEENLRKIANLIDAARQTGNRALREYADEKGYLVLEYIQRLQQFSDVRNLPESIQEYLRSITPNEESLAIMVAGDDWRKISEDDLVKGFLTKESFNSLCPEIF